MPVAVHLVGSTTPAKCRLCEVTTFCCCSMILATYILLSWIANLLSSIETYARYRFKYIPKQYSLSCFDVWSSLHLTLRSLTSWNGVPFTVILEVSLIAEFLSLHHPTWSNTLTISVFIIICSYLNFIKFRK